MTKSKFDIPSNLRAEATRGLYAGAGVADLAVEAVKVYVAEAQKKITGVQKDVTGKVDEARRTSIETRVADLQKEAKALPSKVQSAVDDNVASANKAYADLAKRGESAVKKLRGLPEVKATVAEAKTATAKAKTTRTQAKKATTTAKKSSAATRKAVAKKTAPAKASAKATGTAVKKTAASAVKAAPAAADAAGTSSAS